MNLKALDILVLVAYFVVIAAIGFIANRLVRNREDYVLGGRRFGKAMTIMFAFGAGTHPDSSVALISQSYKYGLAGIWQQFMMVLTLPIYWLLSPIFRRSRVLTTADFFQRRFGREMMYLYSAFSLFLMLSFNGVMFYGSAKVVEALTNGGIKLHWAIILMAIVSFGYAIVGGLIAAVWNDFFQGILTIVMSLLIIPFFWHKVGGLHGFQAAITKSGHPNADHIFSIVLGSDITIFWILMTALMSVVSMVAQPQIIASAAAARSEMDSRIGFVGGTIIKRLMTIPLALTGVMAIAMYGYAKTFDPDHAYGKMAADLLPTGCIGLMLACVMASVMDNCALNMITFAGTYTNSFHQRLINPQASEKHLLLVTRIASIVFAAVSIVLSFMFTDMPGAMRFFWKTVPLMGIPWFFAILWRRANRWGAIASFFAAATASALAKFVLPNFEIFGVKVMWSDDAGLPYTIAFYMIAGISAGIIVSLLTPPESEERTEQFFLLLKTPIGQEHVLDEAGYRKLPGNDTYELPVDAHPEEARGFEVVLTPEPAYETGGVATVVAVAPAPAKIDVAQALQRIDNRQARRQSIIGFTVLIFVVLLLLATLKLLATWLAS